MERFDDNSRVLLLILVLVTINILAWVWAFIAFHHHGVMLSAALLAYSYGLRHAVDADHIAAIDNVTRKLMLQGRRPITVGAFFSLGHSTIVIFACITIVITSLTFKNQLGWVHDYGAIIGTLISAIFLLLMAIINLVIFTSTCQKFQQLKRGNTTDTTEFTLLDRSPSGPVSRLFRGLFHLVTQSWHMYFVGLLFGLGFDTATEIGLLGISATEAQHGLSLWSLMIFPVLFTTGMTLIDSLDNLVMVGAYRWALSQPLYKLYYNLTITAASAIVALVIGGIEFLGLIVQQWGLQGVFWEMIQNVSDNLDNAGFWIVGFFVVFWGISILNYRWRLHRHLLSS